MDRSCYYLFHLFDIDLLVPKDWQYQWWLFSGATLSSLGKHLLYMTQSSLLKQPSNIIFSHGRDLMLGRYYLAEGIWHRPSPGGLLWAQGVLGTVPLVSFW